jgi:hypothetical protein
MESTNVREHSITLNPESLVIGPDVNPSANEEPEVQATEVILDLINTQTHDVFNIICNENMEASKVRNNLTDERSHDVEDFIRRGKQGRPPDVTLSRGRGYYGSGNKF